MILLSGIHGGVRMTCCNWMTGIWPVRFVDLPESIVDILSLSTTVTPVFTVRQAQTATNRLLNQNQALPRGRHNRVEIKSLPSFSILCTTISVGSWTFYGEEPLHHHVLVRAGPAGIHLDNFLFIPPVEELL